LKPEAKKSAPANCCLTAPGRRGNSKLEARSSKQSPKAQKAEKFETALPFRSFAGSPEATGNSKLEARSSKLQKAARLDHFPLLGNSNLFRNSGFDIRNFVSSVLTTCTPWFTTTTPHTNALRQPGFIPAFLFSNHSSLLA
jgi:hypothetical protein